MRALASLVAVLGVLGVASGARADIVYCEHYSTTCWRCFGRFPTATPGSIGPCPIPASCMMGQMCMRSTATAMWCGTPASDDCLGMPTPCLAPLPRCGLEYGVEFCVWTCAPDAGIAASDAGTGGSDSGIGALDAGLAAVDSGPGTLDAGLAAFDSGLGIGDAGSGGMDAGARPADAGGGVRIDAGAGALDASSIEGRDASTAPPASPGRFQGGGGCVCHASGSRRSAPTWAIVPLLALLTLSVLLRGRARRSVPD